MDEPTGQTIDGTPWEEPRGPHLPDPVVDVSRRVPAAAWVFIALALATLAWEVRDWLGALSGVDAHSVAVLAVAVVPPVATCLFGAALFIRHPRARSTDARIVFGIVLLVLVEAVEVVAFLTDRILLSSGLDGEFSGLGPIGISFATLGGLLRAFGLVYIARGLLESREYDDDRWARPRLVLLAAIGLIGVATLWLGYAVPISRGSIDLDTNGGVIGVAAILGSISLGFLAYTYLTATATTGAASGERPARAWWLAALGAWSILLATLVLYTLTAYALTNPPADGQSDGYLRLSEIAGYVVGIGFLLVLAAFALGLPGVDEVAPDVTDHEVTDGVAAPAVTPGRPEGTPRGSAGS